MENNIQRFIAVLFIFLLSSLVCMATEGKKAELPQAHRVLNKDQKNNAHSIKSHKQKNKNKQSNTQNKVSKRTIDITIDLANLFATNAKSEQVDRQGKVDFDKVSPSSGILSNAAKTVFTVQADGVYLIEFYVIGKLVRGIQNVGNESATISFQLLRNRKPLQRTEYNSATQAGQQEIGKIGVVNGFALVPLNSGDKICLVNTSDLPVLLADTRGPVNAALKIIQITGIRIAPA